MKLSRTAGIAAGLLFLLTSTAALAQSEPGAQEAENVEDAPDYSRPGPYMQAGFVQAWSQFKAPDVPNGYGLDLALGGRFIKYFAAEVDFEGVWKWDIYGVDTNTYAVMANAKGYFPIQRFHPFALAGVGTLISQQGNQYVARFAYRFGGGVDVFVTDSIYLSVSYRYTGNLDDFGYTNILWGIGYHFD